MFGFTYDTINRVYRRYDGTVAFTDREKKACRTLEELGRILDRRREMSTFTLREIDDHAVESNEVRKRGSDQASGHRQGGGTQHKPG